ncbi:MAG: glycosyl hydrolase family 8 [bacterium]|nr:glycosyl hydrolase family 8 [bacterium]
MKKIVAYSLIIVGVGVVGFTLYLNSKYSTYTRAFSDYTLLSSSWEKYKTQYISKDYRVVDPTQDNITTSEGQSYGMLRAVWMDDKETFDKLWQWSKDNLQRPNDSLMTWKWGKRDDNSYGPMPNGGENSASDADSDIALALILASNRWGEKSYEGDAKVLLSDLWEYDTDVINGKRYLIAGNWAKLPNESVLNPSYFSPYAYRMFAEIDKKHDWNSLIAPGYEMLKNSSNDKLDKDKSVGLPPDWVSIDRKTGSLKAPTLTNLSTNYSYDAMRIPWRISLDYQWNREGKAYDYLKGLTKLEEVYKDTGKIASGYTHDGVALNDNENPTMYATALGYFAVTNPDLAKKMYQEKLVELYSTDQSTFKDTIPYYEQNWLWFGAGLYNERLVQYKK